MMDFFLQFPGRRPPGAERERPVQGPSRQRVLPPDDRGGLQGRREVRQGRGLGHHQARVSQVPKQVSKEMKNKKLFYVPVNNRKQIWGGLSATKFLVFFGWRDEGASFQKKVFKHLGFFWEEGEILGSM